MRRAKKGQVLTFLDTLGWIGVFLILVAYIGNILGYLSPSTISYLLLNILGSIGILIEAWHKKDLPASALNIIWALIALIQLVK